MGRSVYLDLLKSDWEKAKIAGDAEIRRWASQHLNIQIGISLKSNAWKGAKHWEKNAIVIPPVPGEAADKEARKAKRLAELAELIEACEVVSIGADGGGLDDLFGLVILGRERGSGDIEKRVWRCWAHAWCHDSVLEERKDIAPRLLDFEKDGDLTIVYDPGDDAREIADIVMSVEDAGLLSEKNCIGVDQVGIAEVIEELGRREFDVSEEGRRIVGIPQGWKLNGGIKTTERRLKSGRIKHNGSALMNWCLGNAKVEPRGNAITITKQQSGNAKIDPLMALFNAVVLMSRNPEPPVSVYDRLGDAEAAQKSDNTEPSSEEEAAILANPAHPEWQKTREAYEARLASNDLEEVF
jgi:phage terminase large subunit-like protein